MPQYLKKGSIGSRVKALDFLRSVCTVDADGYAAYDEGWSDKKVARHLKLGLSTRIVADLRREHIGKSRAHFDRWEQRMANEAARARPAARPQVVARPQAVTSQVTDRLAAIERKIDELLDALTTPSNGRL